MLLMTRIVWTSWLADAANLEYEMIKFDLRTIDVPTGRFKPKASMKQDWERIDY
jgi:hypothetical protein